MTDKLQDIPTHEPTDVSEAMREAAGPPADPVLRPANTAAVTKVAKRESQPRST